MELTAKYAAPRQLSQLDLSQSAIIRALIYFDVFNYPLTAAEVFENAQAPGSVQEHEAALSQLLQAGLISKTDGFYHLNGRQDIAPARVDMNERAFGYFPKAKRFSRLISYFPFVEGVFITGSLSKNCMNENGDIDYLIVTQPGRLWLSRALITAFKKIFLLNSRKYFCVNYYVDTESLAIPDKNIFTATEIAFARPAYNPAVCEKFFESNDWVYGYYPNKLAPELSPASNLNQSLVKSSLEKLFKGWLGEKSDSLFFRVFMWRWKKKFASLPEDSFEINFRSRKNVSKHHPNGFQFRVLAKYEQATKAFEKEYNLKLA